SSFIRTSTTPTPPPAKPANISLGRWGKWESRWSDAAKRRRRERVCCKSTPTTMTKDKRSSLASAGRQSSTLLAYAQLCRLPNVFTAIADIAAGYLFVHVYEKLQPWHIFGLLMGASSLLYMAGMVLNDV